MRTFVEVDDEDGFLAQQAKYNHYFHAPKEWLPQGQDWEARNRVLQERIEEARRWCQREFGYTTPQRWGKLHDCAVIGFLNQDDAVLFKMRFC
jgi:hypothetical protein